MLMPEVGMRVIYSKSPLARDSSREGWTGTIVEVDQRVRNEKPRFHVLWDQAPQETPHGTSYAGSAFADCYYGQTDEEDLRYEHDRAYIFPLRGVVEDGRLYIVAGERGGDSQRVRGYEPARELARKKAQNSKSGQAYMVFQPVLLMQRQDPPVVEEPIAY